MDPREPPPQLHQHQHQQPNMLMGPTSYPTNAMIPPNAAAGRFSFNSLSSQSQSEQSESQLQPKPLDSLPSGVFDGSPSLRSGGSSFGIDPSKKKRGRPRKYTPDGNVVALRLATTHSPRSLPDSAGGGSGGSASEPPAKRNRGRPPGSGKKQLDALGGVGGAGFTPHVITVKAGEDIASKIVAFSQQGPRTVCILSASGAICNVTLRQPTMTGGTVTYECRGGRFEIISLSGCFLLYDNHGNRSRSGGLSVSLAGSDGRVLGGVVSGMLMAASPVQIIVGSFIADGKKSNSSFLKSGPSSAPTPHMLSFGTPMTASSPPSQAASSESSDDNGSSPHNRGTGLYNNAAQQPIHNMHMYQLWAGQTSQ